MTGLSDHNMILVTRKLSKKRFINFNKPKSNILTILKQDMPNVDNELSQIDWSNTMKEQDVHSCCSHIMNNIEGIIKKFLKKQKNCKQKSLPWISEPIRKLMKQRDQALKQAIKSKLNTEIAIFKSLRNRVVKDLRIS